MPPMIHSVVIFGNEYMGHKWQCVLNLPPFSLFTLRGCFTDVGMAYRIFSLRFLRRTIDDDILPLQAFANGVNSHRR